MVMNDWWAITRENDLKQLRKITNQFISGLESKMIELEKNPEELISQLKYAIAKFKNEIEG